MAQTKHISRLYEAFGVPLACREFDIHLDDTTAVNVQRHGDAELDMTLLGPGISFDPHLLHFSENLEILFSTKGQGFFATQGWDEMAAGLTKFFKDEGLARVCRMLKDVDTGHNLHERYKVLPAA